MNSIKNQQIIDGIITGDSVILKSFYRKNLPPVKKIILQYQGTQTDVEDIFQDALVFLYQKLRDEELVLQTSIHTYFIGICKNMWRNQFRKNKILECNTFHFDKTEDQSVSVIDIMTLNHQQEIYNKYLSKLNDRSKNIMTLFFDGKSMREISTSIGCTEGYTRKKKYMVKERLIKMIQNDPIHRELVIS